MDGVDVKAPSAVKLFSSVYSLDLDELATFHEIDIRCRCKAFVDSTSTRDKKLYKSCILFTESNSPPNLVRDKRIYSTRAGSILTSAGPAWDLRVQLMDTRR